MNRVIFVEAFKTRTFEYRKCIWIFPLEYLCSKTLRVCRRDFFFLIFILEIDFITSRHNIGGNRRRTIVFECCSRKTKVETEVLLFYHTFPDDRRYRLVHRFRLELIADVVRLITVCSIKTLFKIRILLHILVSIIFKCLPVVVIFWFFYNKIVVSESCICYSVYYRV